MSTGSIIYVISGCVFVCLCPQTRSARSRCSCWSRSWTKSSRRTCSIVMLWNWTMRKETFKPIYTKHRCVRIGHCAVMPLNRANIIVYVSSSLCFPLLFDWLASKLWTLTQKAWKQNDKQEVKTSSIWNHPDEKGMRTQSWLDAWRPTTLKGQSGNVLRVSETILVRMNGWQ